MSLLLLFLLFTAQAVCQTATLTGRVLDPSGAGIPGASIELDTRDGAVQHRAESGASGDYRFANLAPGPYLVRVSARNFSASPATEVQLNIGGTEHNITLMIAGITARTVVTASATAQSTDEVAKAFDVIDSSEVDRRQEFALAEALRLTPGLRIAQLGGPGSLARVQTRGLRTFDTSVLIDGFRFRDVSAPQGDAMGFFGDLLLVDTERVEVLRGSGSSLYGTHAMGGVVNVVSERGGGPMHGEISAEGGGLGMFRGVAKLGGGAWADRLRYTAGVTHLNVTSGVDGYDPYRNSSAQGAASITLSPKSTLGVRLFANDSFVALNTVPYALGALPATGNVAAIEGRTFVTSLNDPDARRSSHFLSTLVNWNYQASDKAAIRANYQGMTTRRDNRDGPGGPRFQPLFNNSNRFDGRIDTAQVRTDLTLPKRNFLTAGYEFERETYDNQSADENPNVSARTFARVRVNQASHSAFIQDQWRMLRDRLQFSLSGRWQHFLLSRPGFVGGAPRYASVVLAAPPDAFTGDAAVSYFLPSSGTKLRAHTGNSYRAPTLYERFGYSFFAGSFSPYGDPLIAPERALAVDAGIDQYLLRSRVRVSATYFYTRLQQVIGFDSSGLINLRTDPYGRSLGYRNTGGGLARGVETSVEAHPASRTRLQAAYTYTKAIERNSTLIGGSVKSIRISPHMFTALASQRIYKGLEVTADLFAASHYVFPFFAGGSRPFDFAGPVKLDVAARYNHPFAEHREMEIYLRIENALNRVYYEDGFRTPKAWAVGGVKFRF